MKKPTKDDRGAALIEFAIVLPLLIMLLMGIVEFGRAYNTQISIQAAAREGAREMALGALPAAVQQRVVDAAPSAHLTPTDVSPKLPCPDGVNGAAVVEVTKEFTFGIPFVPDLGSKTLSATAVMRCGL